MFDSFGLSAGVSQKSIALVVGSTRPGCNARPLVKWIHNLILGDSSLKSRYMILDLADWRLPLYDEPGIPAVDNPVHDYTKAWSRKVKEYDGFLFIMPQYNCGYPAVLKNALDYLYHEWRGKSAGIISYGGQGGGQGAAQLAEVLRGLNMKVIPPGPGISLKADHVLQGLTQAKAKKEFARYTASILETVRLLERSAGQR